MSNKRKKHKPAKKRRNYHALNAILRNSAGPIANKVKERKKYSCRKSRSKGLKTYNNDQ